MNLQPFFEAGIVIQIHIVTALLAFVLGATLLWRRKGTPVHKLHGKLWVGLMAAVALSSFFINELRSFGPFSPIHILSVVSLVSLVLIVRTAQQKNIKRHQYIVQRLFYGGLVGAGVLAFLPGRVMYRIFYGNPEFYLTDINNAWVLPLGIAVIIAAIIYLRGRSAKTN